MMIDTHLKVLISGRSRLPILALAAGVTATPIAMKKVSSRISWKNEPRYFAVQAKPPLTTAESRFTS